MTDQTITIKLNISADGNVPAKLEHDELCTPANDAKYNYDLIQQLRLSDEHKAQLVHAASKPVRSVIQLDALGHDELYAGWIRELRGTDIPVRIQIMPGTSCQDVRDHLKALMAWIDQLDDYAPSCCHRCGAFGQYHHPLCQNPGGEFTDLDDKTVQAAVASSGFPPPAIDELRNHQLAELPRRTVNGKLYVPANGEFSF